MSAPARRISGANALIKKQKSRVRYEAPALETGLDILELLGGTTRSMSLSQISHAADRGRSEIYRVRRYRNAVVIWNAPKLTIDTASADPQHHHRHDRLDKEAGLRRDPHYISTPISRGSAAAAAVHVRRC